MAFAPRRLAQSYPASTAETTIYTVAGGRRAIVKQIILANSSASAATASLSFVSSGGTAGVSNRSFTGIQIASAQVLLFDLSQVLEAGDFISVQVSTGSSIVFTVSGVELVSTSFPATGIDVSKNSGSVVGTRPKLNVIEGTNVTLTVADNAGTGAVDVTIATSGGGAGETDPVVFMGGF